MGARGTLDRLRNGPSTWKPGTASRTRGLRRAAASAASCASIRSTGPGGHRGQQVRAARVPQRRDRVLDGVTVRSAVWKSTPANPLTCGSRQRRPAYQRRAGRHLTRIRGAPGVSGSPDKASKITASMLPAWYYARSPAPTGPSSTEPPNGGNHVKLVFSTTNDSACCATTASSTSQAPSPICTHTAPRPCSTRSSRAGTTAATLSRPPPHPAPRGRSTRSRCARRTASRQLVCLAGNYIEPDHPEKETFNASSSRPPRS